MSETLQQNILSSLMGRRAPGGGFAAHVGGEFRPDATAWAILALQALHISADIKAEACRRLAREQAPDGSVCVATTHPEAYWPTSLAILAWQSNGDYAAAQKKALEFLAKTRGNRIWRWSKAVLSHDPHLKGWSWINGTAPWVEPTSLGVLAFRAAGFPQHERLAEAVRLLLDRQLPRGGWNVGNTIVFDQELEPAPESTGVALTALQGYVSLDKVQNSLEYLAKQLPHIRTPLSLSWGVLGLSAWNCRPPEAEAWLSEAFKRQQKYGPYETSLLALMLIASQGREGLTGIII